MSNAKTITLFIDNIWYDVTIDIYSREVIEVNGSLGNEPDIYRLNDKVAKYFQDEDADAADKASSNKYSF